MYERAAAINEAILGPVHPRVAAHPRVQQFVSRPACLKSTLFRCKLFSRGNTLRMSRSIYVRRCQMISEKVHGPNHPDVATTLNNPAFLLESEVRAVISFQ